MINTIKNFFSSIRRKIDFNAIFGHFKTLLYLCSTLTHLNLKLVKSL